MAKLRIGHVGLNQYLFRFNMAETPLCECGGVENREHFLLHCPNYLIQRQLLYAEIGKLKLNVPISVKLLLGGVNLHTAINCKIVKLVGMYIVNTGRLADL